jgi:hypothetical protein
MDFGKDRGRHVQRWDGAVNCWQLAGDYLRAALGTRLSVIGTTGRMGGPVAHRAAIAIADLGMMGRDDRPQHFVHQQIEPAGADTDRQHHRNGKHEPDEPANHSAKSRCAIRGVNNILSISV